VKGELPFEFNVSHYTAHDLFAAAHTIDLAPRKETILHIDTAHRGLGTGSCGPDTREAYKVQPGRHVFAYTLSML
jgi:beta-galactosidase